MGNWGVMIFTSLHDLRQPSDPIPSSRGLGALGRLGGAATWGLVCGRRKSFEKALHRGRETDGKGKTYVVVEAHHQQAGRW